MKLYIKLFTFTAVFVASLALFTGTSHALSSTDFKPGRIIDDVVFTNKTSMTVTQIQQFLESKVAGGSCDTDGSRPSTRPNGSGGYYTHAQWGALNANPAPFVCLTTYRENPTTKQTNLGNPTLVITGSQTAAEIIYNAGQQYNINPQVLLVLLQKEQSLITDDWPWLSQYQSATGAYCPDTAACDPTKAGFGTQVREAARLFRYYMDTPWLYFVGNNYVLYNPNTACGGTNVYIENAATEALYHYTPYQPNAAALNNLYGTGDSCSAYGNRNFWRLFNDWFGSTTRSLVSNSGGIYIIESGLKRVFPNEATFLSYSYRWSDVLAISSAELNLMPDGAAMAYNVNFRNGFLIRSLSGGTYVVASGTKRPFPNEATFYSYGYTYEDAIVVSSAEVSLIPDGVPMIYNIHRRDGFLVKSLSGGVFVVASGTKRPFPNEATFYSYGYTYEDAIVVSSAEVSLIPDGVPMIYKVSFRNGQLVTSPSKGIYRIENGVKRAFPSEIIFTSNSYKWFDVLTLPSTESNLIPDGTPMSYNVNFRNGFLVRSPSGGIYVVDSGTKRPFPNEATFFSYGYTFIDAALISIVELSLIPEGVAMPLRV